MTVHTNCEERRERNVNEGEDTRPNRTDRKLTAYWVVGLVDAQDEDELREEERSGPIVDYTRLVALHGSQTEEEDGGEEEEAQRHSHCAPRQDFDGENLAVLMSSQGEKRLSDSRFTVERLGGNRTPCGDSPPSWRYPSARQSWSCDNTDN